MTSLSRATVAGVLPVYLFLNQMEVTECVQTIERWTAWLKLTRFLSHGWMTALIKWEKLDTWQSLTFSKDSGKFHWPNVPRRFQLSSHQTGCTNIKLCLMVWKIRRPLSSILLTKSSQILRVVRPTSMWCDHLQRYMGTTLKDYPRVLREIKQSNADHQSFKKRVWSSSGNLSRTCCWTRWGKTVSLIIQRKTYSRAQLTLWTQEEAMTIEALPATKPKKALSGKLLSHDDVQIQNSMPQAWTTQDQEQPWRVITVNRLRSGSLSRLSESVWSQLRKFKTVRKLYEPWKKTPLKLAFVLSCSWRRYRWPRRIIWSWRFSSVGYWPPKRF